jgi:hypothetical protein
LSLMAPTLGGLFIGVSLLASRLHPYPSRNETVISELGRTVFGTGPVYVLLQIATAAILTLAANTGFADFPRVASIIARDGFAPRQLARRGDRLVFSRGIVGLAVVAAVLVVVFGGKTDALVPLYAVGVFTAFTLSQAGMVRHHRKHREAGWQWRAVINAVGAVATLVVLVIIAVTKFTSGAWIPILVIPIVVAGFLRIRHYYDRLERGLNVSPEAAQPRLTPNTVLVLVGRMNLGVLDALNYARSLHPDHLAALHVCVENDYGRELVRLWAELGIEVPLESVDAPFREMAPVVESHVADLQRRWPGATITVVTSQYAGTRVVDDLLHNRALVVLRDRLMLHSGVVVTSVPYRLVSESHPE